MKLKAFFLAESANTREGMLNVLGGYMSHLHREEFPAELNAYVVAVIQPYVSDVVDGAVEANFRVWCELEGEMQVIFEVGGGLTGVGAPPPGATMPVALDMRSTLLPKSGKYDIHFELNDEVVETIEFIVEASVEE